MLITDLPRCFRYDAWANRQILAAVRATAALPERPRQVMAHLLQAQKVWLMRLTGRDTAGMQIWPQMTLDECEPLLAENEQGYADYVSSLRQERYGDLISYRTSTGVAMQSSVGDILTHVLLHGSYHRGQLAVAIKQAGGDPPLTDFIVFSRDG